MAGNRAKYNKAEQEEYDNGEEKYRMYASIAFMAVVLVVGIPMWWKTTEVYRVALPSSDIQRLTNEPIRVGIRIGIFTFNSKRAKLLVNELQAAYEGNELFAVQLEAIPTNAKEADAKTPAALERLILKEYVLGEGDFIFIEWPKLEEEVLMTTERSAIIRPDTSSAKLKTVINMLVLQTHRIQQILTTEQRLAARSEAPQAEYDVVVSVLNPNPEIMDVKWNVQMAVETYIAPFLREVNQISNYTLKTQWKFQLAFEADLKQVRDSSKLGRHYALADTALPHIITSIERYLGVGITDKKAIHLVVYVPPCTIAPIHIYSKNEMATKHSVDSFISPNWGGIIIANPPLDACRAYNENQQPVSFYLQTNDVMQIMLDHLHKLLDLTIEFNIEGVKAVALEQIPPRRWEYDAYIRRSTVMHIATATNTLQSLISLLNNISYIVINDEVGAAINEAYDKIVQSKVALASNQLYAASLLARAAFIASEQAFFDASLLAQLYFPDEQKYAIYIPLFLPIMVPVLTSFLMITKLLIKTNKVEKLKTE